MNKSIFFIDGTEFTFESFGIIGVITENQEFCWAMDLYANASSLEGNQVSPKFSFTQLEQTMNFKRDHSFSWEEVSAYNEEIEDWVGSFYIYDAHYFTAKVSLEKIDRDHFLVHIEGKVNLNWETAPTTNFKSFTIQKTTPFNGILSEIDDEKKSRQICQKYLDQSDLKWLPKEETNSGESNWLVY